MENTNSCHVLYLSYDGMTDPLGQSQVLPYLIGLTDHGYIFHIISFEKPDRFKRVATTIRKLIKNKAIYWYPVSYTKTPPVISTIKDIWKMTSEAKRLLSNNNISIIHSRSYIPALVASKLSAKRGIPFIFDMRGFWTDERVDGNLWNILLIVLSI